MRKSIKTRILTLIITSVWFVVSCTTTDTRQTTLLNDTLSNTTTITGVYTLMNVSQIPEHPIYNGRVFIVLADGRSIALERGEKGIRPDTEIKQFNDTTVKVTGILMPPTVLWGDGSEASIVAEYITVIQDIQVMNNRD